MFATTHPDQLATVARLHGLTPPDPAPARVLELGGGDGMNGIAMPEEKCSRRPASPRCR